MNREWHLWTNENLPCPQVRKKSLPTTICVSSLNTFTGSYNNLSCQKIATSTGNWDRNMINRHDKRICCWLPPPQAHLLNCSARRPRLPLTSVRVITRGVQRTKYIALLFRVWRSNISIVSQFHRYPNFSTKSAWMLVCYGVKFRCRWNWLKIEIWNLQASYNISVQSVSLDPISLYLKIG